nr:hypothetical protein [Peristeroidobacter soli]
MWSLAELGEAQLIGMFLFPFEGRALAIDTQAQSVLAPDGDLTRPQHAARAVGESHHHLHIVIEPAARHERRQLCGDRLAALAGDELRNLVGVCSDIANTSAGTASRRIGPPQGLLLTGLLQRGGEPLLRIFHLHDSNPAELSRASHGSCLTHHRITGVSVSKPEDALRSGRGRNQILGFGDAGGHRLLAEDVDAGIEKRARWPVM